MINNSIYRKFNFIRYNKFLKVPTLHHILVKYNFFLNFLLGKKMKYSNNKSKFVIFIVFSTNDLNFISMSTDGIILFIYSNVLEYLDIFQWYLQLSV